MVYSWEQNDRGAAAGTSLLNNMKTNGPLFAMFPKSAPISEADTLLYNSPNQNHVTTSPTRVFPDLQQILDEQHERRHGTCPPGPIAPPVPIPVKECYSEFLPTSDYVGFAGVEPRPAAAAALPLHGARPADGRRRQQRADSRSTWRRQPARSSSLLRTRP